MENKKIISSIKKNKGKFIVIIIYLIITLVIPFSGYLPFVKEYIKQQAQSFIPKDVDPFFKQYIKILQNGDVVEIFPLMTDQTRQQVTTSSLQQVSILFASSTDQIEGISLNINTIAGEGTYYDAIYEIENNDPVYKYLLTEITAKDMGRGIQIDSVHVTEEIQSIKEKKEFNFAEQILYLIISILLPLFIAYTGFRYIYKIQKPRWIIFLIIIFLSIYINFIYQAGNVNTGVNIGIYGATCQNSLGYWIYMIPIPIGAIYYWIRRKHYESKSTSDIIT